MITKLKNLQFYSWEKDGQEITVVGTRLPDKPLVFSFFIGKDQIEDPESSVITQFVTELKESMSKNKTPQKQAQTKTRKRRMPRRR